MPDVDSSEKWSADDSAAANGLGRAMGAIRNPYSRKSRASIAVLTAVSLVAAALALAAWTGSAGMNVFGAHREGTSLVSPAAKDVVLEEEALALATVEPTIPDDVFINITGPSGYGNLVAATAGIEVPQSYQFVYDESIEIVFGVSPKKIISTGSTSDIHEWMVADIRSIASYVAVSAWAIAWLDAARAGDEDGRAVALAGLDRAKVWFPAATLDSVLIGGKKPEVFMDDVMTLAKKLDISRFEAYQMAYGYMNLEPIAKLYPIDEFYSLYVKCDKLYSAGKEPLSAPLENSMEEWDAQGIWINDCTIDLWLSTPR